jgi:hypothetical protein
MMRACGSVIRTSLNEHARIVILSEARFPLGSWLHFCTLKQTVDIVCSKINNSSTSLCQKRLIAIQKLGLKNPARLETIILEISC